MENRQRPSSNTSSQLQFLSAPRLTEEEAFAAVDQAYFSAFIKLRDIASEEKRLPNEIMCAFGILEVACSHLRLADSRLAGRPPSDKNITAALSLLVNLAKSFQMRQDIWSLLSAADLVAVIQQAHDCVPSLMGILKLISLLSSSASKDEAEVQLAHEVKTEMVKSGVLAEFMDLVAIHDGDNNTEFEFPLTVVRSTCKCILMYGHNYLRQDPNAAASYPRLNRTLWIIGKDCVKRDDVVVCPRNLSVLGNPDVVTPFHGYTRMHARHLRSSIHSY